MLLICTFSPGRTGTGFLSQIFGGEYSKTAIHRNNDAVITHESWVEIKFQINKIKQIGYTEEIVSESNLQIKNKLLSIQQEFNVDKYFITDHRIGRFYLKSYSQEFKVIKINRCLNEIVSSIDKRMRVAEDKNTPEVYKKFLEQLWSMSFYHPKDAFINDVDFAEKWNQISNMEKYQWYVQETERQWKSLKNMINKESYIEIDFDNLFSKEGAKEISNFTGIKYDINALKKRVNK